MRPSRTTNNIVISPVAAGRKAVQIVSRRAAIAEPSGLSAWSVVDPKISAGLVQMMYAIAALSSHVRAGAASGVDNWPKNRCSHASSHSFPMLNTAAMIPSPASRIQLPGFSTRESHGTAEACSG